MSAQRLPTAELRRFAVEMGRLGWTWDTAGSGHLRWRHPEVPGPVFTAKTPRNRGSVAEERAKLERALRIARSAAKQAEGAAA